MKNKIIIQSIVLAIVSVIISGINSELPKEMVSYQFNMFTISTVLAGFSFTTLSMLLSMNSEERMRKLDDTSVVINKSKKIVISLIYFMISSLMSLFLILNVPKLLENIKIVVSEKIDVLGLIQRFIYYAGILSLLVGIIYFIISVYEVYDLFKRVYGISDSAKQQAKEFRKTIEQSIKK